MACPPLHVHLLYHPASRQARTLAEAVLIDWMPAPIAPGLRIPVFLAPERADGGPPEDLDFETAEHTLVGVLADATMANFLDGSGSAWLRWIETTAKMHSPGSRHRLLPVALDDAGLKLFGGANAVVIRNVGFTTMLSRLSFALAVQAHHLLKSADRDVLASRDGRLGAAPFKIFVSHAKKDLDEEHLDPVRITQDALRELPVREWFDARDIPWGEDFGDVIRKGVDDSDTIVVFLTDTWSSRPWCVTEGLYAKEKGRPTIVVDALQDGEARAFPYGGNTRTLRWRPSVRPREGASVEERKAWRAESEVEGMRVIATAVREALRATHGQARLQAFAKPRDYVLDVAPEAAHVAFTAGSGTFLYPDPPVGRDEQRLLHQLLPNAEFVTPMIRFAHARRSRPLATFAVSISESGELAKHGLTELHQRQLTDEVHLYLLLAGIQIVYGGRLDPDHLDDPDNFTRRLFNLVADYWDVARNAEAAIVPILNVSPWPLWKSYGPEVGQLFGPRTATFEGLELPSDFPIPLADLHPQTNGFVPDDTPERLYAWARSMTHMREYVTHKSAARLCIGGKLSGFVGPIPGLLEEPLIQLRAKKPLFLVGALGGATKLVIDLLQGRSRPDMTTAEMRQLAPHHDGVAAVYARYGEVSPSPESIAAELHELGAGGVAGALRNGLDEEENRELFRSVDPVRVAQLVLEGLGRLEI